MSRKAKSTGRSASTRTAGRAKQKPVVRKISGEPSWRIAGKGVEAFLTQQGGHLGPITFTIGGKKIQPLSVAWPKPPADRTLPPILRVLRGDFFCMPFGANASAYGKEKHPLHGETANAKWKLSHFAQSRDRVELHADLSPRVRKGSVQKQITIINGHSAVYQRHIISGMSGEMNLGHHAMVQFPDVPECGIISTSPFVFGQTWIEPTELPENRGYSALKPGEIFTSLEKVPTVFGDSTDLTKYPARRGYEDLAMIIADDSRRFAWTAVAFPQHGYVWFALKDPRVLRGTLFWISNGGRHMPPWNGNHVNVVGLEEVTSYFATGLAQSAGDNHLRRRGFATTLELRPSQPTAVNYIMGVAPIKSDFDRVAKIEESANGVCLTSASGMTVDAPLDPTFLYGGAD